MEGFEHLENIERDDNEAVEDGEMAPEEAGFMQGEREARSSDVSKDDDTEDEEYEEAFTSKTTKR